MANMPVDPLLEFSELCRLCGAKTSVLMGLHIFEREGNLREIYKKIKACLPIVVANDDRLPKMVCEECVYKLDAFYEFREKSVKSEYLLTSMMKGLYATPPRNQQFPPAPPSIPIIEDLICPTAIHATNAIQLQTQQVGVNISNSVDPLSTIVVELPMSNVKCENENDELVRKNDLERKSSPTEDSDPLAPGVPVNVSHGTENCAVTEHIVNNIEVADIRTLHDLNDESIKSAEVGENRHFIMATHAGEQPWFFCDICGKPFGDSNEFQAHCEIHWKKCQLCGVTCANDDALMLHLRESHSTSLQEMQPLPTVEQEGEEVQENSSEVLQVNDSSSELLQAQESSSDILNDAATSDSHLGGDMDKDENADGKKCGLKSCPECGKQYRTNYKLAEHMRKHTGEKPFQCSICEKTFRSKIGLAQHEARHTGLYDYTCSTCGKGFQCKSYLIVHQRVHSDLKPYLCTTCDRNFKTKQSLLDHQNRHLGVKPYLCETCGRGFITKGLCKSHQKVHSGTDNRQYPCSVCSKRFVSKSYLATHMRIHTGEKPFMCEVCGKGFLTRVDLKIHSTLHTGEKSFVCEVCGKAFARRAALRCHKRSHTGERPYKCDICGQGFTQFTPMATHKRLHTGERPYACDICQKTFVSRSTMMSHRKKHVS